MKILFITPYFFPHIGGVEKHTRGVGKELINMGHDVTVLTEKYDNVDGSNGALKETETVDGIKIVRFPYPHIKFIGLKFIWFNLLKNIQLIKNADVIHIHDVFIWYLPFRIIFPNKKIYTTFHGWEGVWPIPKKNILYKRLAAKLSIGTIAVGKYIEKYYGIKVNKIIYGGTDSAVRSSKIKNTIAYIGRLNGDTGVLEFLKWLDKNGKNFKVTFVGDGELTGECQKYGEVTGFGDPVPYLKKSEYIVPGGYLTYIAAKTYGCKIKVFANSPLKKDYWAEIEKIDKFPTWGKVANEYLDLYKFSMHKEK